MQVETIPCQRDGSEPGGCFLFTVLLHRHLLGLGQRGLQCISLLRNVRTLLTVELGLDLPLFQLHLLGVIEDLRQDEVHKGGRDLRTDLKLPASRSGRLGNAKPSMLCWKSQQLSLSASMKDDLPVRAGSS